MAAILVVGASMAAGQSPATSKANGCRLNHKSPPAHTIVLLDETDRLSRQEVDYARHVIMDEYYWLPVGGQLTVRNIVSDPDDGEDIVVCRLDDGSKVLGIGKNPKKVRKDFERIAGTRLHDLLLKVASAPVQKYSPIMESVANVSDRADFGNNVKARRLVLVSDMAQHSPEFSQYRSRATAAASPALADFKRDMSQVAVRVQYVPRPSLAGVQGARHKRFWTGYFKSMGAADVALGHNLLLGEENNKRETWSDVPE